MCVSRAISGCVDFTQQLQATSQGSRNDLKQVDGEFDLPPWIYQAMSPQAKVPMNAGTVRYPFHTINFQHSQLQASCQKGVRFCAMPAARPQGKRAPARGISSLQCMCALQWLLSVQYGTNKKDGYGRFGAIFEHSTQIHCVQISCHAAAKTGDDRAQVPTTTTSCILHGAR